MAMFYATNSKHFAAAILLLGLLMAILELTGAQSIGVCYGGNGNANNLPPEQEVVDLYKANGIGRMRIYTPYPEILQPLDGSNIELMLGVA
ncbi:hypothetical protein L1049_010953 [Liquidambar formosana]|uniref:Glucan endo-1,3-beta-D-glucosidase n=1 Tax=Liquidambar formosana TaxID=63359 RepID=A0AAP0RRH7_LIQFO